MNKISVIVLTHNNENTIHRCLNSIKSVADEIIIVDDFSCDKTLNIIKEFSCKVYSRNLGNDFSEQRNFGISKASNEFILTIDSDEELDDDLIEGIKNVTLDKSIVITCDRLNKNFCGYDKVHLDRRPLIMHNSMKFQGSLHEYITYKKSIKLNGTLIHNSWVSLDDFMNDINVYSSRKALAWHHDKRDYNNFFLIFRQMFVFIYQFLYRYIIEARFKHGACGFLYCLFWASEELAVGLKYMELKKKIKL
tara:strand:+ start:18279 stop:19028 length:750 start_codon:yes stop_codon:yes gene_type:complete